jgi:hypothetical protein
MLDEKQNKLPENQDLTDEAILKETDAASELQEQEAEVPAEAEKPEPVLLTANEDDIKSGETELLIADEETAEKPSVSEEPISEDQVESQKIEVVSAEQTDENVPSEELAEEKEVSSAVRADNEEKEKKESEQTIDFSKLDLEKMIEGIDILMSRFSVNEVKNAYFDFKKAFDEKYEALYQEQKEKFIAEGGDEAEFSFISPLKTKYNSLARAFKKKRQEAYQAIENERKENLSQKQALIERLKHLIDNAEPASMYKEFKDLQSEWRRVGPVPTANDNDIWQTYQHHVERFYDLLHLSNEYKDLDFKHNLDEKIKLAEKAEALAVSQDVEKAFRELQVLHRLWKEEVGPVAREFREEVWHRFSEATKLIHEKRHGLQKEIDHVFEENIALKNAVIEKIKQIDTSKLKSHNAWQDAIKKIEEYHKEFLAIGRVTREKNEEIWTAFKNATRDFNKGKNEFFKSVKNEQLDNLKKKMILVEQAEALKDSEDVATVTEIYKKIQADWKKIGHVPKKDSDRIWNRFKDACNHFFERVHQKQEGTQKTQTDKFDQKKELLGQFKEGIKQDEHLDLDKLNSFVDEWRSLGTLPENMGHLEAKFNKALDSAYKKLDIDEDESAFLKFKNNIDSYLEKKDTRKIESEHHFIRKKCDELIKEIKQLENNVGFITNATESNPLVQNVMKHIQSNNEELKLWQRKLKYLNKLNY